MFEALESRELFSATLTATDADPSATEPGAEPAPVMVEANATRDAASGQATGKRSHMPIRA